MMYNCQCGSFALCHSCVTNYDTGTDEGGYCDKCEILYCGNSERGCVDPCQADDDDEEEEEEEEEEEDDNGDDSGIL
jgi:hypothetical protein